MTIPEKIGINKPESTLVGFQSNGIECAHLVEITLPQSSISNEYTGCAIVKNTKKTNSANLIYFDMNTTFILNYPLQFLIQSFFYYVRIDLSTSFIQVIDISAAGIRKFHIHIIPYLHPFKVC